MRNAVYAGTFDPPTNGHLWVINQAARIFDTVTVAVATNPEKKALFSAPARVKMIEDAARGLNVRVVTIENQFVVNYASTIGAGWLVRGVRNASDFEYEHTIRHLNSDINDSVETVLFQPPRELSEVSSSLVRGLVGFEGWERAVAHYVPSSVMARMIGRRHHWLWEELARAGAQGDEDDFWQTILTPYFGKERVYHNGAHLSEVLNEILKAKEHVRDLAAVGFAAVCHDIDMDESHGGGDEERSADFARSYAKRLGLPEELGEKSARMVLATKDHRSDDSDTQCLLGADTAILGAEAKRFDEYERGVAEEYATRYTPKEFSIGRAAWIVGFLDAHKERIYAHPFFETTYGESAKRNLNRSLARIQAAL